MNNRKLHHMLYNDVYVLEIQILVNNVDKH